MLQGRPKAWGPQVFLDGAAVANTRTAPNKINYIQPFHTFLIHLAPQAQWEVAINTDRKTTGRTVPGSIDIAPKNSQVHARWAEANNTLRVDIDPSRLQHLAAIEFDNDIFDLQPPEFGFADRKAFTLALLMQQELERGDSYSTEALDALVTICSIHLLRNYSSLTERSFSRGGLSPLCLRRLKDFIRANIGRTLTTEELAEVASLSPSHFSRAFKRSTGQSPHKFVINTRLAHARDLILGREQALSSIAISAGFSSHSHMTAQMKRFWGITPSKIRNS